jgi:hypothetical protein
MKTDLNDHSDYKSTKSFLEYFCIDYEKTITPEDNVKVVKKFISGLNKKLNNKNDEISKKNKIDLFKAHCQLAYENSKSIEFKKDIKLFYKEAMLEMNKEGNDFNEKFFDIMKNLTRKLGVISRAMVTSSRCISESVSDKSKDIER